MKLPSDWQMKSLGEVATLQRGFDLPVSKRVEGAIPIFAANGPVGTHNVAKIKGPGVITGRSGTIGKVHLIEADYWPLNTSLWVKDFHGNDPKWVFRLLSWMRLETHTRGTGVPTLNRNLIHVVKIPLPPLDEQRRIAAILDKADAVRRKRKDAIALTKDLLRSAFLEMFGDPVTNPKGWDIVSLEKTFERNPQIGATKPAHSDGKQLIVRVGEIGNRNIRLENCGRITLEDKDLEKNLCKPGDFLLARAIGSESHLGKASILQAVKSVVVFDSHVMRLRFSEDRLLPEVFLIWLKTRGGRVRFMREAGRTAVQFNVNAKQISRVQIPLPPIILQREFVGIYKRICLNLDRYEYGRQSTEDLFNSLLQRAFRGDL